MTNNEIVLRKSTPAIVSPENRPEGIDFEKIWNRAKDKDVAVVIMYDNDGILCIDAMNHALSADEVIDCCEQGCIIVSNTINKYRPVYWTLDSGAAKVLCIDNSGTSGAPAAQVFTSYMENDV